VKQEQRNFYESDDGLPRNGFVRARDIIRPIGPLPISRSTLWAWIAAGRLTPIKLGPRVTAFRVEDVRALLREHDLPESCGRQEPP
jgi:prophage regulatory protein